VGAVPEGTTVGPVIAGVPEVPVHPAISTTARIKRQPIAAIRYGVFMMLTLVYQNIRGKFNKSVDE
jgi:hypothetical protein